MTCSAAVVALRSRVGRMHIWPRASILWWHCAVPLACRHCENRIHFVRLPDTVINVAAQAAPTVCELLRHSVSNESTIRNKIPWSLGWTIGAVVACLPFSVLLMLNCCMLILFYKQFHHYYICMDEYSVLARASYACVHLEPSFWFRYPFSITALRQTIWSPCRFFAWVWKNAMKSSSCRARCIYLGRLIRLNEVLNVTTELIEGSGEALLTPPCLHFLLKWCSRRDIS
jgi:hypothetical protein